MENRINRKDDESLYQPKIHSDRIRVLYTIKQVTGKPMTVLLDQAIRDLAQIYNVEFPQGEQTEEPIIEETWEEVCEYRAHLDRLDYLRCLVEVEKIKSHEQRGSSNKQL